MVTKEVAIKIKKWEHIPVRPTTFKEFRNLKTKEYRSDDAIMKEIIKSHGIVLRLRQKKREQEEAIANDIAI